MDYRDENQSRKGEIALFWLLAVMAFNAGAVYAAAAIFR